ncbi:MAG: DUF4003 family protein [Eubacterium sp.]|nr:DUF4003 family protein [Eubacterium sp.]
MNEKLQEIVNMFIGNLRVMVEKFPKVKGDSLLVAAAMAAREGIAISEEKMALYTDRVNADGFLKKLTDDFRLFTVGKLLVHQESSSLITHIQNNYGYIDRVTDCTPKQVYLGSVTMSERFGTCSMEEADQAFYVHRRLMSLNPFVLHNHDVYTCAVLAVAHEDPDKLIDDIQHIYDICKTMYPMHPEQAKYAASVMCMAPGDTPTRCKSIKPFLDAAKKAGKEYDVIEYGIALGLIPLLRIPMDEFIGLYSKADDMLTPLRIFGRGKKAERMRRSYALIMAAIAALPYKDENGTPFYRTQDCFTGLWIAIFAFANIMSSRFRYM